MNDLREQINELIEDVYQRIEAMPDNGTWHDENPDGTTLLDRIMSAFHDYLKDLVSLEVSTESPDL